MRHVLIISTLAAEGAFGVLVGFAARSLGGVLGIAFAVLSFAVITWTFHQVWKIGGEA